MQVWNVLHAARWKYRKQKSPKIRHLGTTAQLRPAISLQLRHVSRIGKKLVKQQCLPTCPHNMVNFGLLAAEICWRVWGTPANFNGFRVLAALLHGTLVPGVSQTLRHWTEGATYIRQGGHHVWALAHISSLILEPMSGLWKGWSYEARYLRRIMAAIWNRAGHYIFALWFLSSSFFISFFFPRLISAVADWMSTILLHMVWL